MHVSVAEAAEVLGVHPQRVHQRIREGSLPAEKIGNQWSVEMNDLRRIRRHARPGRPLSSKSAWDLLAVVAGDRVASELSPSARSRARSRLRNLLVLASSAELDDAAALLVSALRNRAERALFAAYLLSPAPRSRANVIFHVIPSDAEHEALADLDDVAHSPLALAADLAEHDGVREKSEALRSVAELHARFVVPGPRALGAGRG